MSFQKPPPRPKVKPLIPPAAPAQAVATFGPQPDREAKPIRTNDKRSQYVLRDRVMKELSDLEIGRISQAEGGQPLSPEAEYLDLERLEAGVQRAQPSTAPLGSVLPRASVGADTWTRIVALTQATGTDGNPAV